MPNQTYKVGDTVWQLIKDEHGGGLSGFTVRKIEIGKVVRLPDEVVYYKEEHSDFPLKKHTLYGSKEDLIQELKKYDLELSNN